MTGKLSQAEKDQLEQWIGKGPKQFELLYAITRHGCNAAKFHQLCDSKGPTVTVLYNCDNSVYGGYTNINWNATNNYQNDAGAFLFQLKSNGTQRFYKFPSCGGQHAVYTHQNYGPTFGGNPDEYATSSYIDGRGMLVQQACVGKKSRHNHDFLTFTGKIGKSGGYFQLNGCLNIRQSYRVKNILYDDMDNIQNCNMNVTELEVYQVVANLTHEYLVDMPIIQSMLTIIPTQWRKTPPWNEKLLDVLMEEVTTFRPFPDLDISEARIAMLGPVGAGKSSFYNTINSIFRGRITQKAGSGSGELSFTTAYTPYLVRTQSGGSLNFRICDTRGLEDSQGIDVIECNYLLDGHIPEYYEFNPVKPITPSTAGFISKPTLDEKIHCVVFVLDATTVEVISDKIIQKMKSFQTLTKQKGIPQAILLTKIDKLCENVEKNTSNVYTSPVVKENVEKVSQLLGIPRGNVFPVKNYENEVQLDTGINILSLLSLRQILNFAEDYMEGLLDKMAASNRREPKNKSKEKK